MICSLRSKPVLKLRYPLKERKEKKKKPKPCILVLQKKLHWKINTENCDILYCGRRGKTDNFEAIQGIRTVTSSGKSETKMEAEHTHSQGPYNGACVLTTSTNHGFGITGTAFVNPL